MSDSKLKTTVEILPLRDSMENRPAQRLDQSFLVDGYAIGRYSGTGDTIICELSERPNQRLLENSSPVICYTQCGFDIISIHQNEVLQVMDVKSKKSELFKQAKDSMQAVRRVAANNKYIVAIAQKRLIVWDRSNLDKPPREVDTSSAPTPITTVSDRSAMTQEDRVVIVNNSPGGHIFQVWDITAGKLCCYAENKGSSDTYTVGVNDNGVIAATCRDTLCVWLTAGRKAGENADITEPSQKNTYSGTFLSSLYIDNFMIITGDNYGGLCMHTAEGYFLHHMNQVAISGEMADLTSTTNRTELASLFRTKVNKIVRVGRWVFAGFENSHVNVYDLFITNAAHPVDSFTHSVNGTVIRDVSVYSKSVYAIAVQPADSKESKALKTGKSRVDLITWYPTKIEHDDIAFFYGDQKLWHGSPVGIVRAATTHALAILEKIESAFPPGVLALNKTTIKNAASYLESISEIQQGRGFVVPFSVTQNAQFLLDEYSSILRKITKGNKYAKYCDQLETLRVKFMLGVNLCLNSAYFLTEVKTKNGTASPFCGKEFTVYHGSSDESYGDDRSFSASTRFDDFSDERSVRSPSVLARAVPTVKEAGIEGMLSSVLEELGCAHDTTLSMIESFDDACNKELRDQERDQDRINPLLSIFTKLRQLDEDMKETAKELSKLCGMDAVDEFEDPENPSTWWGQGGEYDDGAG